MRGNFWLFGRGGVVSLPKKISQEAQAWDYFLNVCFFSLRLCTSSGEGP